MKYIIFNIVFFFELVGLREFLEFSCKELSFVSFCDERNSFSGIEGKKEEESYRERMSNFEFWI